MNIADSQRFNSRRPLRLQPIQPKQAAASRPWGKWSLRAVSILWLVLLIMLPISTLIEHGLRGGLVVFRNELSSPIALGALKLTLITAAIMTAINAVMGTLTAYVLVRYRFTGSRLLNSLIDLPFAIPTLVTGVMLVVLYGPQQLLGAWLEARGIQIIFARPGIVLALLFITYPFVIRTVQPVLLAIDRSQEEAAWTLGASPWQTFTRIILPLLTPAILTGSLLGFARALGEFGSLVVVAGNIPGRTLTAPVYIYGQIESENQRGASAMSLLLLTMSFGLMLLVDWLQERRGGISVDE
ncbi:MAG: sulfate ABC transporter permease subunit CysT [Blastocatellia bacterium]|nr:sulfate ABC transporter permease subunit CysT [Blastocatellia bacterium]